MTQIDLTKEVIGIPLDDCLVCGKGGCTRHHAIPKELKPKRNVTIPLCEEHKDVTHHIKKQFYIPRNIRRKLGRGLKELNALTLIIKSLRKDFQFNNK